jgi:DNA-binding transcriptional LysR family regulator
VDRFQAVVAFVRVLEAGSYARAAERLDRSVSALSRQVAELESHLGVRLLNRTTRRLSLTESGQAFHERCVQLLADLDEAEEAVTATAVVPRGTLRLAVAGTGVTLEPDFVVANDVRAGRLVALLPGYTAPSISITAAYPRRRHLSAKVRVFVDYLAARFERNPQWRLAAHALAPARGRSAGGRKARAR